jgi:hypothetical protein
MRKVVLEIESEHVFKKFPQFHLEAMFDSIERFEIVEVLRLDVTKGVKIVIADLYLESKAKTMDLEQIQEKLQNIGKAISGLKIFVLQTALPKITCLLKMKYKRGLITKLGFEKFIEGFNMEEISPDLPMSMSKTKFILSIKGNEEPINKALKVLSLFMPSQILSVQKATFGEGNLLGVLTDQQRNVILAARSLGYYTYPRKVNAEALAQHLNLSKNTVIEHLRKAENRLINQFLAGY